MAESKSTGELYLRKSLCVCLVGGRGLRIQGV